MTRQPPKPASVQRKLDKRLASIVELARALAPHDDQVFDILAKTERKLKQAQRALEALPGEFERMHLVPAHGPTIEFAGALLRHQEFDTAQGKVRLEIWQTDGGALIAVDSFDDGENGERLKVCTPTGGIEDQRMAIMEFFNWSNRARSMARKLGWSTLREMD